MINHFAYYWLGFTLGMVVGKSTEKNKIISKMNVLKKKIETKSRQINTYDEFIKS